MAAVQVAVPVAVPVATVVNMVKGAVEAENEVAEGKAMAATPECLPEPGVAMRAVAVEVRGEAAMVAMAEEREFPQEWESEEVKGEEVVLQAAARREEEAAAVRAAAARAAAVARAAVAMATAAEPESPREQEGKVGERGVAEGKAAARRGGGVLVRRGAVAMVVEGGK